MGGGTKEPVARRNAGLDEDDLMFGGMERVVNAPVRAGDNHEATIRITCQKELEIYMSTPGIPLRKENKKFSEPLA